MKKTSILILMAILVVSVSGVSLAQMDKDKAMMGEKPKGMMGMMKGGMKEKGGMMKMHGMMMQMMEKTVVATSDGGIVIVTANKISKYDKDLNLIKEVELKVPTMEELQKMCPMMGEKMSDMDNDANEMAETKESAEHQSHHPENK